MDFRRHSEHIGRLVQGLSSQITEYTTDLYHIDSVEKRRCFDIARNISALLKDDRFPMLAVALMNQLQEDHPGLTRFTVEKLNDVLCEELNQDLDEDKEEPVLDLSNHVTAEDECIDLAKHLSAALNSPKIPGDLKVVIANDISDLGMGSDELAKFVDSPE